MEEGRRSSHEVPLVADLVPEVLASHSRKVTASMDRSADFRMNKFRCYLFFGAVLEGVNCSSSQSFFLIGELTTVYLS